MKTETQAYRSTERDLRELALGLFRTARALFELHAQEITGAFATEGLINISTAIMNTNGVQTEVLRPIDYRLASGVYPDMTAHGWDVDEWPEIYEKVEAASILVICSPIWLEDKSSVCTQVIERLYSALAT
jgi:multimeric flavodoxin WrbA